MKVRTVMPGSRNAATSDCTDCGALKKVLLWESSNIFDAAGTGPGQEQERDPSARANPRFYRVFRPRGAARSPRAAGVAAARRATVSGR
jgi:hypothetical protein